MCYSPGGLRCNNETTLGRVDAMGKYTDLDYGDPRFHFGDFFDTDSIKLLSELVTQSPCRARGHQAAPGMGTWLLIYALPTGKSALGTRKKEPATVRTGRYKNSGPLFFVPLWAAGAIYCALSLEQRG